MTSQEYLAKILRAKTEIISEMEKKMSTLTGKDKVIDNLIKENEHRIKRTLTLLDCHDCKAEKVFQALITRLEKDDRALYELFKKPSGTTPEGLRTLFNFALELAHIEPLFVLKKEKAEEFLRKNPPPNIIKALKYKNVNELLVKEDLTEIFSALRFVESNEWMHKAFDGAYPELSPNDFEKREIELRVLSDKWLEIAKKFVKKKYHNISHLKELGVIFVIPLKIDTPGETLRMFSLILHYMHEIDFYSKLIEKASKEVNFGKRLISLMKGEVLEKLPRAKSSGINWMIIQQYLAKHDKNDPRLFIPHVNPEAVHWQKAEQDISHLGKRFANIDIELWLELDWVGGFFKNKKGNEELISFDLVDNIMALVQEKEGIRHLYHHQEALWTRIFEEYMGMENSEKLMITNFDKGFIAL
jgi:hypothetical protein